MSNLAENNTEIIKKLKKRANIGIVQRAPPAQAAAS